MNHKIRLLLNAWKEDYTFKTIAASTFSFAVTILFALYNGFLGIYVSSVWHGSIGIFYLLLVVIRGLILLTERKSAISTEQEMEHSRRKTFLISSIMLLVLNIALILPITLMVELKKPVNMGLIPAIAMATYVTYKVITSSIHIKGQKRNSQNNVLIVQLRTINFIDALVSILTLQNTLIMVNQEESSTNDMLILSAVSSAVIYILVVYTTIRLLRRGIKMGNSGV